MVTLVQLEYIVAVDTHRHFATAAKKCFVTQPTLSMQIRKLEEQLGVTIFDRSKQPVIPTDVGREIVAQARQTLRNAKKLGEIVKSHQEGVAGKLTIGIVPTLAPYILHRYIQTFVAAYPKVTLEIHELLRVDIVQRLKKDMLDLGIVITPLDDPDILESTLFYEEIKAYVHPEHKFARKKTLSTLELSGNELWSLNDMHCFHHQVNAICHFNGFDLKERSLAYQASSFESVKKMVDLQGGYTLLPELVLEELHADERQVVSFKKEEVPLREIGLIKVRNQAKKNLIRALATHIRRTVPSHMLVRDRGNVVTSYLQSA